MNESIERLDGILGKVTASVVRARELPGLGGVAIAMPDLDRSLRELGLEVRGSIENADAGAGDESDVFLATQLYSEGGHTALIGDFVNALSEMEKDCRPRLVLSNIDGVHEEILPGVVQDRTHIPAERTMIAKGGSVGERLLNLAATLRSMRIRRLFLFHHPEDPVPSVLVQPGLARDVVFVHHADATPSLGLTIPGIRIIDLNPVAMACTRLQGLQSDLLLLTAPDPGPRLRPFLESGKLVTATCGSPHKYIDDYRCGYTETVAVILAETGGSHVHIGPLKKKRVEQIQEALESGGIAADRFVHVPRVSSLSQALWDNLCDVYLSSFPVDGARSSVEVAASGTPYLTHRKRPGPPSFFDELGIGGRVTWHDFEQLREALAGLSEKGVLEEKSVLARRTYDKLYSPDVFRETLERILAGKGGAIDPNEEERVHRVSRMLMKSVTAAAESLLGLEEER